MPAWAPDGALLTLEEQDRSLWHRDEIARGLALVPPPDGAYSIQAAIAACHARAATADETDWAEIVELYDRLLAIAPSPVVELGRAIAIGMRDGPDAALAILDSLALPAIAGCPRRRRTCFGAPAAGREAAARFREAIRLTPEGAERDDLERRLAELGS